MFRYPKVSRTDVASVVAPAKAHATLMTLPTELRIKIYEQVYIPEDTQPNILRSSTPLPNLSLPRTCRQIYSESLPVLFSTAPFALSEKRLAETRVETVLGFLKALGDKLSRIRRLDILWDSKMTVEDKIRAELFPSIDRDTFVRSSSMDDQLRLKMEADKQYIENICKAIELIAEQAPQLDYLTLSLPIQKQGLHLFSTEYGLRQPSVAEALVKIRGVKRLAIWDSWKWTNVQNLAEMMRVKEVAIYWSSQSMSNFWWDACQGDTTRAGWKLGGWLQTEWVLKLVPPEAETS